MEDALIADEQLDRYPIGSDPWIDSLRDIDSDAMELDDLDVSKLNVEQAVRLWSRLSA